MSVLWDMWTYLFPPTEEEVNSSSPPTHMSRRSNYGATATTSQSQKEEIGSQPGHLDERARAKNLKVRRASSIGFFLLHKVQPHDTLQSLCLKFNCQMDEVLQFNALPSTAHVDIQEMVMIFLPLSSDVTSTSSSEVKVGCRGNSQDLEIRGVLSPHADPLIVGGHLHYARKVPKGLKIVVPLAMCLSPLWKSYLAQSDGCHHHPKDFHYLLSDCLSYCILLPVTVCEQIKQDEKEEGEVSDDPEL